MPNNVSTLSGPPGPPYFGITTSNKGTLAMPDCTGYCYYRAYGDFHSFPVTSNSYNASEWGNHPNTAENGSFIRDRNGEPGDILVYSANHVSFVEGDGRISESAYTTAYKDTNGSKVKLDRSKTALDLYNQVVANGNKMGYNMAETSATVPLGERFGSIGYRSSGSRGESINYYTGRLHHDGDGEGGGDSPYEPGGGGDSPEPGGVLTEPHIVQYSTNGQQYICKDGDAGYQDSGSQDGPKVPEVYDQSLEDKDLQDPTKHGRTNKRGEPLNVYTYCRDITYELNSSGKLVPKASNGTLEESADHSGSTYVDWDTALNGPITGGKINW